LLSIRMRVTRRESGIAKEAVAAPGKGFDRGDRHPTRESLLREGSAV